MVSEYDRRSNKDKLTCLSLIMCFRDNRSIHIHSVKALMQKPISA